ncbi:DUF1016 N-terminal domain-containing protein [Streptomyces sp. NPDC032161]|uniref:DUF1016 N-terminal domain-containing protein n=1 Tax=unclassified Streptomyces TaxID=2593676 RepID=UPI0033C31B0A
MTKEPMTRATVPAQQRTAPELPPGFHEMVAGLKSIVRGAHVRARLKVNTEMLRMYGEIGRTILESQGREKWGAKVIERIATELRTEFPDQRGFSRSNLHSMQQMARTWDASFAQQAVAQMPWGHVIALMSSCETRFELDFYAQSRDETTVEFALQLQNQPLAVRTYATLPPGVRELMPSSENLSRVAREALRRGGGGN